MSTAYGQLVGHQNTIPELDKLPDDHADQLIETCDEVNQLDQPTDHPQVKVMAGHRDFYRVRSGDYRAIVDKHLGQIRVLLVGHRDTVYDHLDAAERRSMHR